jgi:hypothetical protein
MSGNKIIDGLNEAIRGEAARITVIKVNGPWERVPTCACDPGVGDPPTKLEKLQCRLRGGPCSPSHEASTLPRAHQDPESVDK